MLRHGHQTKMDVVLGGALWCRNRNVVDFLVNQMMPLIQSTEI